MLKSLVLRSQNGDVGAFSTLLRTFQRMAWGYAYARICDAHLAEDVCQEAFVDAYRKIHALRSPEAFPGWLKKIVRTHADRLTRKRAFTIVPYLDDTESTHGYGRPDEAFERGEEIDRIQSLLAPLPPAQRMAATLCYIDGCNIAQISMFLDVRPGTIRKRLFDARKTLATLLRQEDYMHMEQEMSVLLERHLSPKMIGQVLADPSVMKLRGEIRTLSALFVDAENAADILESMSAGAAVGYLNAYLEAVYRVVIDHDGFMDKVVGDEIMAFWGAPLSIENSAEAACRAALAIQDRLAELSDEFRRKGLPDIKARIGINTGEAIIGTFGPVDQPAYTPQGRSINLAARMEGEAKRAGESIAVTGFTRDLLGDSFAVKEIGTIQARSYAEPVRIYALLGKK
jgi:RNA polymerase sigma factor (sigma-70 family)